VEDAVDQKVCQYGGIEVADDVNMNMMMMANDDDDIIIIINLEGDKSII